MTKTKITKRGDKVTIEEIKKDEWKPVTGIMFLMRDYEHGVYDQIGVFVDWSGDSYRGSGW